MGVDDIINKGKQMFEENREKIEEALKSEKAEEVSDKLLDGAAERHQEGRPGGPARKGRRGPRERRQEHRQRLIATRSPTAPSPGIGGGAVAFTRRG